MTRARDLADSADKDISGTLVLDDITLSNDISIADNGKAIFGAGSDLQIYHDGSHSYISDQGTGQLRLLASQFQVMNAAGTESMVFGAQDNTATLYYDNAEKLATTATGVDVTGTVQADGLTVEGGTGVDLLLHTSAGVSRSIIEGEIVGAGGGKQLFFTNDGGGLKKRMQIDHLGDISFYEDTGSTPKFFWDASAERLGIRTSSPQGQLSLSNAATTDVMEFDTGPGFSRFMSIDRTTGDEKYLQIRAKSIGFALDSGTDDVTIDSSGNVGIGTSSPTRALHVNSGASNEVARFESTDTEALIELVDTTGSAQIRSRNDFRFYTNGGSTRAMDIDASGNVGIGTASPSGALHVSRSGLEAGITLERTTSATAKFTMAANDGNLVFTDQNQSAERLRLDASGNLLVGKTAFTVSTAGHAFMASGQQRAIVNGDITAIHNRLTSDGDIVQFRKDSTTVGSIGAFNGDLSIGTGDTALRFHDGGNRIEPFNVSTNANTDGVVDLGITGARFNDIYATNGTIQTSDRNEKQDIDVLSDAESRVAVACKGLLRKFRWQDAVAEKGDDARIHFGIIAQDLQDAFAAEGLDAGRYAMFISSTWWETQTDVPAVEAVEAVEATYDEDGNELTPAVEAVEAKEAYTRTDAYGTLEEAPEGATERTRLGVRYPELLAFIIAAI